MRDPLYLSPVLSYKKFFERLKVGDFIEYSLSFTKKDVIELCEKYGFKATSCNRSECDYYGISCLMKVSGTIKEEKEEIKHEISYFNPEELVL